MKDENYVWSNLEQALYFNKYINDNLQCPFTDINNVHCESCIFFKIDCINDFDKCNELTNKIILENRIKKLERICGQN